MKPLGDRLSTLRAIFKTPEIVYSFSLIILIPVLIVINSITLINVFTNVTDAQAEDKAVVATKLLNDDFSGVTQKQVQAKIDKVTSNTTNQSNQTFFKRLDYFVHDPHTEAFDLIASSNRDSAGQTVKPEADSTSSSETQASPYSFSALNQTWSERSDTVIAATELGQAGYRVNTLIADPTTKNRVAVLSAFVSTEYITSLLNQAFTKSAILLVVVIGLTLAMLFIRSRIYRYSTLFKKLQEVDQMKDEFISIASHELRTPLTSIRGSLSMILEEQNLSPEEQHKMIQNAERSSEQLTALVADLLDVSRIEQGRLQIAPEKIDIGTMIKQVVDLTAPTARPKKLALEFVPPAAPLYVRADRQKLQQVLVNLTGNAVKYTMRGSVTIKTEVEKDAVAVLVSDTGIGMSPEDRANLFKKFYRIRNAQTEHIGGTGLGLWITKSLVELMGGEIFVDSIKDSGTQVKFTLPKA